MTQTTSTSLAPVYARARLALREGVKLSEVAKQIALDVEAGPEAAVDAAVALKEALEAAPAPFPDVPKAVELTAAQKTALVDLSKVFNKVTPTTRRALTGKELFDVYAERRTIREILEPLQGRDDQIKEYVRTHMDVVAEQAGVADPKETPRDAAGHYVIAEKENPEKVTIPETGKAFSREFRAGKITISGGDLLDLYEAGEITRETYLSFTREQRVFDEKKATEAILKDPSKLEVLRKITHRDGAGTALFERKA